MAQKLESVELPSDANASGRSFGAEELVLLQEVIDSGVLNCTRGTMVKKLEEEFATWLGVPYCRALSSGTAAVHAAIAAVDPAPGDEIITTPITDMGAIAPILYQTAIPVFADVDPDTYCLTAESIAERVTSRTRAVIVTHLFGNACEMDSILELCNRHGLVLIEDCAQAYGTVYRGRRVGTLGQIACFSLQQGKHISCGEGGLVVTSDPGLHRRMVLFSDKAWGYGDPHPDHYFLAPNYRLGELCGAVALAQLRKLPEMIRQRVTMAECLTDLIGDLDGVHPPSIPEHVEHSYWKFPLKVTSEISGGADALGEILKELGVWCAPRYIQKPAYECMVIRDRATFRNSRFPFEGAHRSRDLPIVYSREDTPGTIEALETVVVLPINERYQVVHIEHVAAAIRHASEQLS